jgi:hypothetical protein
LAAVALTGAETAIFTAPASAREAGKAIKTIRQNNLEGLRLGGPAGGKTITPGATTLRSTVVWSHSTGMAGMSRRR